MGDFAYVKMGDMVGDKSDTSDIDEGELFTGESNRVRLMPLTHECESNSQRQWVWDSIPLAVECSGDFSIAMRKRCQATRIPTHMGAMQLLARMD